jgi:hypothetical protein
VMKADNRYAASDAGEIQRTLPGLEDISFPSIRTWRIAGDIEFLASLNLGDADDLIFRSMNSKNRFFAPIPSQLTELEISRVTFAIESLPGGQRHSLPRLVGLTLVDVIFISPMSNYFHLPELRSLDYSITLPSVRSKVPAIQETLDSVFCREASALEFMGLEGITLNDALVRILASCPNLLHLDIDICLLEEFIHPFLERLQDPQYLPLLRSLSIEESWPFQLDLSYSEFAAQCHSRWPEIRFFGNA